MQQIKVQEELYTMSILRILRSRLRLRLRRGVFQKLLLVLVTLAAFSEILFSSVIRLMEEGKSLVLYCPVLIIAIGGVFGVMVVFALKAMDDDE